MAARRWHMTSRQIDEVVRADDQFGAWNTLRNRPVEDFGLIVTAAPQGGDARGVHDVVDHPRGLRVVKTTTLMEKWGRAEDAARFHDLARENGLE